MNAFNCYPDLAGYPEGRIYYSGTPQEVPGQTGNVTIVPTSQPPALTKTLSLEGPFPIAIVGAKLQYLRSIGTFPVLVLAIKPLVPDFAMVLAGPYYDLYVREFGDGEIVALVDPARPDGNISITGVVGCNVNGLVCPPGYLYDSVQETCVYVGSQLSIDVPLTVPPQPPPESPTPQPLPPPIIVPPIDPGQPDSEGDEITDTLCQQMQANTLALIQAIQQAGTGAGSGGGVSAACCTAVVNAIAGIEATLIRMLVFFPSLIPAGGSPLDLSPIITELTCLCDSLKTIAGTAPLDLSPIADAINQLRDSGATADPNIKRIADDADILADPTDPEGDLFVQYLVDQGALDSAIADKIKGSQ
jgi:hypothetical protein